MRMASFHTKMEYMREVIDIVYITDLILDKTIYNLYIITHNYCELNNHNHVEK